MPHLIRPVGEIWTPRSEGQNPLFSHPLPAERSGCANDTAATSAPRGLSPLHRVRRGGAAAQEAAPNESIALTTPPVCPFPERLSAPIPAITPCRPWHSFLPCSTFTVLDGGCPIPCLPNIGGVPLPEDWVGLAVVWMMELFGSASPSKDFVYVPTEGILRTLVCTNWCGADANSSSWVTRKKTGTCSSMLWALPFVDAALTSAWTSTLTSPKSKSAMKGTEPRLLCYRKSGTYSLTEVGTLIYLKFPSDRLRTGRICSSIARPIHIWATSPRFNSFSPNRSSKAIVSWGEKVATSALQRCWDTAAGMKEQPFRQGGWSTPQNISSICGLHLPRR